MSSSFDLDERSVAVVVSARLGKVASDTIDERDVCRGCGVNILLAIPDGARVMRFCARLAVVPRLSESASRPEMLSERTSRAYTPLFLASTSQSPKPQSYIYNSLIFCAYPKLRSNAVLIASTSLKYMASGHCDLILRTG